MIANEPRSPGAGADPLERARRLAPLIEASAAQGDAERRLMPAVVEALIEADLYRMLAPRALGGAELPPSRFVEVIERVAMADGSTAWCLCQNCGCSMAAAFLAPDAGREMFGAPDGILAWGVRDPAIRAVRCAGGYRLTGEWQFLSGGHQARWIGAQHVQIASADGTPELTAEGRPVMRTLIFPRAETRAADVWHVIGLRGTASDTFSVTDLFVPEAHSYDFVGAPHSTHAGALYRFSFTAIYAVGFAGVALGLARRLLGGLIELAREKTPRLTRAALRDNHVVQSQVAQAQAKLTSARLYLLHTLGEAETAAAAGELPVDQRVAIRLAASFATLQAREVADIAYHAAGSTAVFEDNPFERPFRDIHTVTQQVQARQAHFEAVGQYLLGLPPNLSGM